uniref:Large ribosomal subunit protein mL50 n=1 Tax=Ditylenchus dipsaci TaxID=166011 RepID=A0A915ELB6_9BILA
MSKMEMEALGKIEQIQDANRRSESINTLEYFKENPEAHGKREDGKYERRINDFDDDYNDSSGSNSLAQGLSVSQLEDMPGPSSTPVFLKPALPIKKPPKPSFMKGVHQEETKLRFPIMSAETQLQLKQLRTLSAKLDLKLRGDSMLSMNPSVVWRRYLHVSSAKHFWKPKAGASSSSSESVSVQQKEHHQKRLPQVLNEGASVVQMSELKSLSGVEAVEQMDSIRARGMSFLRSRNNYKVPPNVETVVKDAAVLAGINISCQDWQSTRMESLESKQEILSQLASLLKHQEPVSNITKYAEMARDEQIPANIAIREHADRFHPEDKHKVHGGITAFPGDDGIVLGLRNKRLIPEYSAKKEWYDFEDQSFDYSPPDKGMPWDPEVARKMDRYVTKKFFVNKVRSVS